MLRTIVKIYSFLQCQKIPEGQAQASKTTFPDGNNKNLLEKFPFILEKIS